jgi:hypothetical protein
MLRFVGCSYCDHKNTMREQLVRRDGGERLTETAVKRLIGVQRDLWIHNGLESGFHFKIECESSIVRRMQWVGDIEALAHRFLRTSTLQNRPGLRRFAGETENTVDLVTAGKSAPIKKNRAIWRPLQQEARRVEHHFHHEIVLLNGIFDISWGKNGGTNFVLAEHCALRATCQCAGKRGFTSTGKTGHENYHFAKGIVLE